MQALLDVDAELELDELRNVKPVQLIMEYPSKPPVVLLRLFAGSGVQDPLEFLCPLLRCSRH